MLDVETVKTHFKETKSTTKALEIAIHMEMAA